VTGSARVQVEDGLEVETWVVELCLPRPGSEWLSGSPHWHTKTMHQTVLTGTLIMAMGESLDSSRAQRYTAGSFLVTPAGMRHVAATPSAGCPTPRMQPTGRSGAARRSGGRFLERAVERRVVRAPDEGLELMRMS
jgi:hypothetical protein